MHRPAAKAWQQEKPAMKADRQRWMDLLRGLAMFMVIVLHATLVIELFGKTAWPPFMAFSDLFAPFRMPLLVFLSGLLLDPSLKKGWGRYLEGKARRIAYPYLLWTLLYSQTIYDGPDDHTLWIGASYLWYILFLLVYYCLALVTGKVPPLLIASGALVLSAFMPEGSKYYERFLDLMGMFFLGHAAIRFPVLLERFTSRTWALAALPVAVGLSLLSLGGFDIRYKAELILPTLAGIAACIHFSRKLAGRPWTRPLEYMGEHSLIFYLIHYPLIYLIMYICLRQGMESVPLISLVALVVAIPACFLAARLYQKSACFALLFEFPPLLRRVRRQSREDGIAPFTKSNRRSI